METRTRCLATESGDKSPHSKSPALLGTCNLCGFPVLRIGGTRLGTRCLRCRSTQIHRAVALVVSELYRGGSPAVYELSSRGALCRFLRQRFRHFACSEYFEDVPRGQAKDGVVCQDVERLTHADASFDLVTATEVFEHVADDRAGFREVFRVLRPGGHFVFTVPLEVSAATVERCRLRTDGSVEHWLDPAYHGDRIRGRGAVLVFRDYGPDILDRLEACGFRARVRMITARQHLIRQQPVVVARKEALP